MSSSPLNWPLLPREIRTSRMLLRPFALTDVDDVLAYASNPEWGRYLPAPQPYSRRDAEEFIARSILRDWEQEPAWALEYRGSVVGAVNLPFDKPQRKAMIGYSLKHEERGQGLAFEAAQAVVDAAFKEIAELNRIWAIADARNVASHRVLEKLGMQREGILRQDHIIRGEVIDDVFYGLLRSEWTASRQRKSQ